MSYQFSQRPPASMSTEDLIGELDGFTALAAEVAVRVSLLLKELRARRQHHPFFHHPVLKFFKDIANLKLDAVAAIRLTNGDLIRAVLPLPTDYQRAIALGRKIPVATFNQAGEIVSDDMEIRHMDPSTLRRAFGPDGIRSVYEQTRLLRAESKVERHGLITVLRDEVMLKIGNQRIRPEELRLPLMALGFRLDALSEVSR